MIICAKGKFSDIRNEFDLLAHYHLFTGKLPEHVQTNAAGYLRLVEKDGSMFVGRYGIDVLRQVMENQKTEPPKLTELEKEECNNGKYYHA